MSRTGLALAIAINLFAVAAAAQDVLTIGTGSAAPGASATVPVYVRDVSGTTLGVDAAAGHKLQGIAFKVSVSPASSVASITFARAGVLASLTPLYEQAITSSGAIGYIGSFAEATNPIPFVSNAAAPGNLIGNLQVTLSGAAPASSSVTLTVDPATATFSNQAGTSGETVALGSLAIVNGSVSVSGSAFGTPAGLLATAASTSQVNLTWNAMNGIDHFEVWRSSNGGAFALLPNSPATNAYADTSVQSNTTYLYYVKAVSQGQNPTTSAASNTDYATTIIFTDDPLTAGTLIKTVHLAELRTAVNAFRAAAGQTTPLTFTDDPVTNGVKVKAVHIQELRNALDAARSLLGYSTLTYTDAPLTGGVNVKTAHVQQLRDAIK